VARVRRHPELAVRPTVLYLVEFTDWDVSATDFHKIGVGTTDGINRKRGGQCDRLYRHHLDGARLLDSFQGDLLTCLQAEELIVAHVAPAVYTPTQGRIRGGNTECFLPSVLVELEPWVRRAREALHSTTEVVWA
jgi:hypothetical protein